MGDVGVIVKILCLFLISYKGMFPLWKKQFLGECLSRLFCECRLVVVETTKKFRGATLVQLI